MSAADVEFEVKEDGSVTEVEMKDEKTSETPKAPGSTPKTGDDPWKPAALLLALCGASALAFAVVTIRKRKQRKKGAYV